MTSSRPPQPFQRLLKKWRNAIVHLSEQYTPLDPALRDELFELQNRLQEEVFGSNSVFTDRADVDEGDRRLGVILDVLGLFALSEPDDPAHPWMRGGVLARVGRHLEAAEDFLLAAHRFDEIARGASETMTGDEADWADSARFHAARNLALGGHPASAAALLPRLSNDNRNDVLPIIREKTAALA